MPRHVALFLAAFSAISLVSTTTQAGLLSDWNVLVRTNMTTSSHVDGSAKVGGNLNAAAGVFSMHLVTAANGDGLAVGGNISGNSQINSGGNLRLGGINSGTVLFNGGGTTIVDTGVASQVASDFVNLDELSQAYSLFAPNGTVDGGGNMNATPVSLDGQLVAIYTISAASLSGLGQLNLNIGSADSVIINVTGTNVSFVAPPNIIGGFSQANSTRILWNLPQATTVTVNNSFNGALLAPLADLAVLGGGMNGAVAVNSISNQNAEIRRFNYTGYVPPVIVPEPASGLLLGMAGIVLVGWRRLRKH
jgi:choice-of-anchor A domain-containing protein